MATFKLTISEVQEHPENFMYIYADENKFLRYIDAKHAAIIRQKKANQLKILGLCAKNAGVAADQYYEAVYQGFKNIYGITPYQALVKLAKGDTVAGKNWSAGVYGVGAISDTFAQKDASGATVKVDPKEGHFIVNGRQMSSNYIARKGCPDGYGGFTYVDSGNNTFISSYSKVKKQYYADTYTTADGKKYKANGKETLSSSDSVDIWNNVLGFLSQFATWLINLFGGGNTGNMMTPDNTIPQQTQDGFDYQGTNQAGIGTMGIIILGAVAAGTLLQGDGKSKKKSKK